MFLRKSSSKFFAHFSRSKTRALLQQTLSSTDCPFSQTVQNARKLPHRKSNSAHLFITPPYLQSCVRNFSEKSKTFFLTDFQQKKIFQRFTYQIHLFYFCSRMIRKAEFPLGHLAKTTNFRFRILYQTVLSTTWLRNRQGSQDVKNTD